MIFDRLFKKPAPANLGFYRGADKKDHRQDWKPTDAHPYQVWRADIKELRARSRDLARNAGLAASFLDKMEEYVVGVGIKPQPIAKIGDRLFDSFNEEALELWVQMEDLFDISGQQTVYEVVSTALRTAHESGMALIHMPIINDPDLPVRMGLFGFEPDFLAGDFKNYATSNEVRGGIEIQAETRKPVAFWVAPEADFGFVDQSKLRRIPADEVAWFFNLARWGQVTGIPTFARVLGELYDHQSYVESEIVRADWNARQTHYIKTPFVPQHIQRMKSDPQAPDDLPTEAVPRGTIRYLYQNEDVIEAGKAIPPAAFKEFMQASMRKICAGLGMSYELVSGDHTGTHFSASRAVWVRDNKFIRTQQEHLIRHVCNTIWKRFIDVAVSSNALPTTISDYFGSVAKRRRLQRVSWLPPGVPWHDPAKDIAAAASAVALGIRTRTSVCASIGVELMDNLDTLQAEELAIFERKLRGIGHPGNLAETLSEFDEEEEETEVGAEKRASEGVGGVNGKTNRMTGVLP